MQFNGMPPQQMGMTPPPPMGATPPQPMGSAGGARPGVVSLSKGHQGRICIKG